MFYHKHRFKNLILYILSVSLLVSCTTGNKFASSFGKRKYNKGYYVDVPGKAPKANTTLVPQHDNVTSDITSTTTSLSLPENRLSVKAAPVMQYRVIKPSEQAKPTSTIVPAEPAKAVEAIKGDGGGRHTDDSITYAKSHGIAGFVDVLIGSAMIIVSTLMALSGEINAAEGLLLVPELFIVGIPLAIIGLILCNISLMHHDVQEKWGRLGLIFALVVAAGFFAFFFILY